MGHRNVPNLAEWEAERSPLRLIAQLRTPRFNRQLRLFACGCCRQFWHLLSAPESRRAVEIAERFADGQATLEEQAEAGKAAHRAHRAIQTRETFDATARAAGAAADSAARHARTAANSVASALKDVLLNEHGPWNGGCFESPQACNLLRDLVPIPPQATGGSLPPASVLAWSNEMALRIAERVYAERDFTSLPLLADALEEAGCSDARLLEHCRAPGPHVRGCWALDLLLSKDR
jgi:hypothetical protein